MIYCDKGIRNILVERAKIGATIQYGKLNDMLGQPYNLQSPSDRTEMGNELGDISEFEYSQGRPLLSSIVVNMNGTPGIGFYEMTEKVGLFDPSKQSKKKFLEGEQQKVYDFWKNY